MWDGKKGLLSKVFLEVWEKNKFWTDFKKLIDRKDCPQAEKAVLKSPA